MTNHRLRVSLPSVPRAGHSLEIDIDFHGTPKCGIRFFPERQQVYTVFSTSQWMVCVDDPADKATFTLKLILPASLTPIANGQLVSKRELPNNKRVSEWRQSTAIPTYIFGFAAGPFHVVKEKRRNVELQYFATNYTESEMRRIFRDTPDMLDFFEDRAGVKYADRTYTQVLAAGGVEQEMSSFTALKEVVWKAVAGERTGSLAWGARVCASVVGQHGDLSRLESLLAQRRNRDFHGGGLSRTSLRTRGLPARDRNVSRELRESASGRQRQVARLSELATARRVKTARSFTTKELTSCICCARRWASVRSGTGYVCLRSGTLGSQLLPATS